MRNHFVLLSLSLASLLAIQTFQRTVNIIRFLGMAAEVVIILSHVKNVYIEMYVYTRNSISYYKKLDQILHSKSFI